MAIIDATDNSSSALMANILDNRQKERSLQNERLHGFRQAVFLAVHELVSKQGLTVDQAFAKVAPMVEQIYPEEMRLSREYTQGMFASSDTAADRARGFMDSRIEANAMNPYENKLPVSDLGRASVVAGYNPAAELQTVVGAGQSQGEEAGQTAIGMATGSVLTKDQEADNNLAERKFAQEKRESDQRIAQSQASTNLSNARIKLVNAQQLKTERENNPQATPDWQKKAAAKATVDTIQSELDSLAIQERQVRQEGRIAGETVAAGPGETNWRGKPKDQTKADKFVGAGARKDSVSAELDRIARERARLQEQLKKYTLEAGELINNKPSNPLDSVIGDDDDDFLEE